MRTLDISVQDRASRTAAEWLWPLLPIGAAVFCLSALIYFHVQYDVVQVQSAMQVLVAAIYKTIGFAPAVMFFLLLLTWSSIWFVTGRLERPLMRIARLVAMAVMLGVFLNLGDGGVSAAAHKGDLGAWLAGCLVAAFGYFPSIVLVWAVTFASLLLATDFFFSDSFEQLRLRPRTEVGVETAVTDHLRGLGSMAATTGSPPRPTPLRPAAAGEPLPHGADLRPLEPLPLAPELDFLRQLEPAAELADGAVPATDAGADADAAAESDYEPRRRRSYFERRREERWDAEPEVPAADQDLDVAAAAEWAPAEVEHPTAIEPADAIVDTEAAPAAERGEDELDLAGASGGAVTEAETAALAATDLGSWSAEDSVPEPLAPPEPPESIAVIDDQDGRGDAGEQETSTASASAGLADEHPPEPEYVSIETAAELADAEPADEAEPSALAESVVAIPRPDSAPRERQAPSAPRIGGRRDEGAVRQQKLFAAGVDEELMGEAIELARGQSRVTAALLQRRLRIDYQQAMDVLTQLGARGVVELDADASQGRVVV